MLDFVDTSLNLLHLHFSKLIVPALFFFGLSTITKRTQVFAAFQRSFSNSVFNLMMTTINVIALTPILDLTKSLKPGIVPGLGLDIWNGVPSFLVMVLAVFCGDFIGYWRHRLEHSHFLWPSHMVHHSDTEMTWFTLERFHPFNRLSTYFIDTIFLLFLSFPPYAIFANLVVRHYYGFFIHADLPWTFGIFGKVFVSPVMHRWHHVKDEQAHHANYATVFSFIDRMFGTYRVPGLCQVPLGVDYGSDKYLIGQLLHPLTLKAYYKPRKNLGC